MGLTTLLLINGSTVAQPQGVEYIPRIAIGKTLMGSVIWQGDEAVTYTYHHITAANLAVIQALYSETSQSVTITGNYPRNGSAVTRSAIWEECSVGSQKAGFYTDVTLKFSRLGTAQ